MELILSSSTDLNAISVAANFKRTSQSKELILRLETKTEHNFVISKLLHCLHSLHLFQHSSFLLCLITPLHRVDCMRAYACRRNVANGMNNRPYYQNGHAGAAWNRTMQPLPINTGMNSINNLSNPEKPYLHILQHPTGTTLEAGEDLMLRCVAEGEQTLIHYSWFKDNVELGMHEKLLIVEDVAIDDSGEYRCEVQQDHIRVSSEIAKVFVVPQNIPEQTPQAPVIPCPSGYVGSAEATYVSLSVGAGVPDPAPQTPEISCDGDGAVPGCSSDTSDSMESNPQSMYHATDKYALLIANEKYLNNPPLTSASNDVKALATTLKEKLQFKTISLINLNLKEMHRAVDLFCAHLSDGAYCLTYLAGHGFENDGQCYIVPTDAPNRYSSSNCFPVKEMIKKIHDSCHLSLTVVLLDVCRKRNENAVNLTQQSGVKRNLGNFVISFATMESGMAYEVKGQRLGVYVSSLRRHLGKDKRVTRVLELVHKDLHRDLHTKGVQQPEFKSNMFEDRKLTDPIPGLDVDPARKIRQWEWKNTHERTKPVGFFFESCGLMISLDAEKEFSNVLQLTAKVHRLGLAESCDVFIKLKRSQAPRRLGAHGGTDGSHEEAFTNSSSVKIENLQRLIMEIKDLPLAIRVQYVLGDYVYTEEHEDFITIPFVTWWHS